MGDSLSYLDELLSVMRIARELIAFNISISCPGIPLVTGPFSYQFFSPQVFS